MKITAEMLAESVWGTGYGSKRHLIDHEHSQLDVPERPGSRYHRDFIKAKCSATVFLDYIDGDHRVPWSLTQTTAAMVGEKEPCGRCAKRAAAQNGAAS